MMLFSTMQVLVQVLFAFYTYYYLGSKNIRILITLGNVDTKYTISLQYVILVIIMKIHLLDDHRLTIQFE